MKQRLGPYTCERIKEVYQWPNDHFMPQDPCEIVFLEPWDDLDIVGFQLDLEERLRIAFVGNEWQEWTTLSDVVDTLASKLTEFPNI